MHSCFQAQGCPILDVHALLIANFIYPTCSCHFRIDHPSRVRSIPLKIGVTRMLDYSPHWDLYILLQCLVL